jgi:FtsP/CotA-like multicopper oxidase with cupredoxin domain
MQRLGLVSFFAVSVTLLTFGLPEVRAAAADSSPRIAINDNRAPAGSVDNGALTVRLTVGEGDWRPDADTAPGTSVLAFGLEGAALQIPGPIIRVTEGTEIHAFVKNPLVKERLILHGLYTRTSGMSAAPAAITIDPGQVREIRFLAGAPGTYFYWGATTDVTLGQRVPRDSQLSGALIVDPRGRAPRDERIFVIGVWQDPALANTLAGLGAVNRMVMNGKSWPHTERLTYAVGVPVHIRVVNAGAAVHPMHLHGFYFNVDSRGDEMSDTIFPPAGSPHLVNTERMAPARTFSLTWTPTRPGNWLFHCHDTAHIRAARPLDGSAPAAAHHVANHALEMMAGPVIGITVTDPKRTAPSAPAAPRRHLRLIAKVDTGGTPEEPAWGFALEEGTKTTPAAPPYLPSPTIVLKRGEPVSITVVNQLPEATGIHWHGIELDSYYDGVAGFAGMGTRIAPAIQPGTSFDARFTPPRSGTFIYHTHVDEVRQQKAGLNGALLVVDDPAKYDPTHDIALLVSLPRLEANRNVVYLNGSSTPAALELKAGEKYRLRFINIHVFRPSMRMRLLRDDKELTWRAIAKDGMDLPTDQATVVPSVVQMGNGETYDFEFAPDTTGDLRLDITSAVGDLLVRMPIHVLPPSGPSR